MIGNPFWRVIKNGGVSDDVGNAAFFIGLEIDREIDYNGYQVGAWTVQNEIVIYMQSE